MTALGLFMFSGIFVAHAVGTRPGLPARSKYLKKPPRCQAQIPLAAATKLIQNK